MIDKDKSKQQPDEGGEMCVLKVRSPRSPKVMEFRWSRDRKISDVAKEAGVSFGYAAGHPTFIDKRRVKLDRDQTLKDEQVIDLDELELTDSGGGV